MLFVVARAYPDERFIRYCQVVTFPDHVRWLTSLDRASKLEREEAETIHENLLDEQFPQTVATLPFVRRLNNAGIIPQGEGP